MEIKKLTDKYDFYQDGNDYIIDFGTIKNGDDTKTLLSFSDVKNLEVKATCGCTVASRNNKDDGTIEYTITYNKCNGSFDKTLSCKNGGQNFKIKLQGICR